MSEKAERRRQLAELKKEKARRTLFIQDMLKRPDGREFVWWLLTIGKYGTQPMAQTPYLTAFACGELNIGQQIFAEIISVDPAGFLRMQQERNDAERSSALEHADTGEPASDGPDSVSDPSGSDSASARFSD